MQNSLFCTDLAAFISKSVWTSLVLQKIISWSTSADLPFSELSSDVLFACGLLRWLLLAQSTKLNSHVEPYWWTNKKLELIYKQSREITIRFTSNEDQHLGRAFFWLFRPKPCLLHQKWMCPTCGMTGSWILAKILPFKV